MRVQARDNANIKKEAFDVFSCILIMPQPTRLPLPAIARFPTSIDPQFLFSLSQAASRSSQQRCQIIALHSAPAVRLRVRRPPVPLPMFPSAAFKSLDSRTATKEGYTARFDPSSPKLPYWPHE